MLLFFMASGVALVSLPGCYFVSLRPVDAQQGSAVAVGTAGGRRPCCLGSSETPCPQELMAYAFLVSHLGAWVETGTKSSLLLWPGPPILKDIFSLLQLPFVFPKFAMSSYCLLV